MSCGEAIGLGTYFRTAVLPTRVEGGPLFDRPKRGRKKPHQPALAHVRSRRRAGPRCVGRLGSASGQRIARARRVIRADSLLRRSDIDSHDAPLRREAAFLRRSAKGPEGGLGL